MAEQLTMGRLLGFHDFFPNENAAMKKEYANLLGREFLFRFTCHFLSFFRINKIPPNEILLQEWFTFNDFKYFQSPSYHHVSDQYKRILNFHPGENFFILCVESLLQLFMWTSKLASIPQNVAHDDASLTLPLLKLYLLFNDDVLENYSIANKSVKGHKGGKQLQAMILAGAFPQHDFLNIDYAQLFYTQFYKAVKLLNFLSTQPSYARLYAKFLLEFNCETKEEYFRSIGTAVVMSLKNIYPTWTALAVTKDKDFEKNCTFLETLSIEQDDELIFEENDYLQLRSKPFQKEGDGRYRVVFDAFLIKKVYNGLFFKISEIDRKNKEAVKQGIGTEIFFIKDFLGTFRDEFSEGVLVYETLSKIYQGSDIKTVSGNEFTKAGLNREPDYYIRKGNDILLFESKDIFIPGKVKLSYDFIQIEAEFKKKNRFEKAIFQLKENVRRAINRGLVLDDDYSPNEIRIFPIIIVHDSLFSAPALNYWLNYWLVDAINELKNLHDLKNFDFKTVMPLTIIEIDTLILYESHLTDKDLDLIDMIIRYHNHVKFGFNGPYNSVEEVKVQAFRSALSFSEFVRDFSFKKNVELKFNELDGLLNQYGIK